MKKILMQPITQDPLHDEYINKPDFRLGSTPLRASIAHARLEAVQLLLEYGAETNFGGYNALHLVAARPDGIKGIFTPSKRWRMREVHKNLFMADLIINTGVGIDIQDQYGDTPLHYAARNIFNDSANMIKYLLTKGADTQVRNGIGMTPQEGAIYYGCYTGAAILEEHNKNPIEVDKFANRLRTETSSQGEKNRGDRNP